VTGLRSHMRELHRPEAMRRSNADLARSHASEHHRYGGSLQHHHAGPNRGANERPAGWRTGADVTMRDYRM